MKKIFFLLLLFLFPNEGALALPSYQEVRTSYVKSDSLLLDRNGELLHELRTDQNRRRLDWTLLQDISSALKEAVIQAEDKRFYAHAGVDYRSMGTALFKGLTSESLRGASTITMQLASMLDRSLQPRKGKRSVWQKGKQILAAIKMEKSWSKTEILEAYLNLVPFRGELQGIAAASRGLLGKDPHGLDRSESLILASLIRSPNASPEEVARRGSSLGEAMKWPSGNQEMLLKVRQVFEGPKFLRPQLALAPQVARKLLGERPHKPATVCTLERNLQRFTQESLRQHLLPLRRQNVKDGAILIVENRTGEVLAYVSYSGDPSQSRFVDGVQAKRQAGSTLKPFLYALAFDERILTPASLLDDSPLNIAVATGIYQPRNYDSQFRGLVTSRIALASSLNVPAVRTLSLVGVEPFLKILRQLGIKGLNESGNFYGPSLAVGSADISLWEEVNAYRTLARGGEWSELRLTPDSNFPPIPKKIFSREAAFLISDILSDRDARSLTFGLENPLATRFWTAVKTGTSKDMRDNWCIGYSSKYTVGVWAGNFTGEPMWNVSGITGAAPVWTEVMNWLHRNDTNPKMEIPVHVVSRQVKFPQGLESSREEWFISGTEPNLKDQRIGEYTQRIVYPQPGTVIALDPDIPPDLQKIFFVSQIHEAGLRWRLNNEELGMAGKPFPWTPSSGKYLLSIADNKGRAVDSVRFEVRGPKEN